MRWSPANYNDDSVAPQKSEKDEHILRNKCFWFSEIEEQKGHICS